MRKASAGVSRFRRYQRAIFCGGFEAASARFERSTMVDRLVQIQHLLQRCHIAHARGRAGKPFEYAREFPFCFAKNTI
jgi:hypothetical protein